MIDAYSDSAAALHDYARLHHAARARTLLAHTAVPTWTSPSVLASSAKRTNLRCINSQRTSSMTSADVRDRLIAALRTDLVGPALPDEILNETPTRWYLTGFLAPLNAGVDQRSDPDADDEPDLIDTAAGAEDNASPERPAARRSLFPASLGLSLLVSADTPALTVQSIGGIIAASAARHPTRTRSYSGRSRNSRARHRP